METMILMAVGVMLGTTAARVHPVVNPGLIASAIAGAIGGLAGADWWGATFAEPLGQHDMAGALAGAGAGGMVFGMGAGLVGTAWKRWSPPLIEAAREKWHESRSTTAEPDDTQ